MNIRAHIRTFRIARQGWLDILTQNPDSLEAAQHIVSINAKIDLLNTMRFADGDYEPID